MQVKNVWNVNSENVLESYLKFMQEKAKELNIVINPSWLNVMNYKDHNTHLSFLEYTKKEKKWCKIKRMWNVDKYIHEVLKGYKEKYKTISNF